MTVEARSGVGKLQEVTVQSTECTDAYRVEAYSWRDSADTANAISVQTASVGVNVHRQARPLREEE